MAESGLACARMCDIRGEIKEDASAWWVQTADKKSLFKMDGWKICSSRVIARLVTADARSSIDPPLVTPPFAEANRPLPMEVRCSSVIAYQENEVNQQVVDIATQLLQPFKELVDTVQFQ